MFDLKEVIGCGGGGYTESLVCSQFLVCTFSDVTLRTSSMNFFLRKLLVGSDYHHVFIFSDIVF